MNKVLATFPRTTLEEIRISESEFNGKNYIDIRVWVIEGGEDNKGIPTKKGITILKEDWSKFIEELGKLKI